MTDQERHAAAVETLRALRSICERYPTISDTVNEIGGCLRCPLNEWCGTRSPESISDEEIEQLADLAMKEAAK